MAAFPSITPSSVSLIPVNPTRVTTTLNGIQHRQAVAGQYFRLVAQFTGLNQSELRQIQSHVIQQGGPLTSFEFTLPDYLGDSTGAYTGSISLSSDAAVGQTSVSVSSTGATFPSLKSGDLIRFASHDKIYTLTTDVASPGTTLAFYPALRSAVTTGQTVTHQNLTIKVRYAEDSQDISVGTDLYSDITLQFVEVL